MIDFKDELKKLIKSRIFLMFAAIVIMFSAIIGRLFYLQVVRGEYYESRLVSTTLKTVSVPAPRGNIYDRYGKPLAENETAYSVIIDDSIAVDIDLNTTLKRVVNNLSGTENDISVTAPISGTSLTLTGEERKKFLEKWGIKDTASDSEIISTLYEIFDISEGTDSQTALKIISLGLETSEKNLMILNLVNLLDANGETLSDDLPISKEAPFSFLLDSNESKEESFKSSIGLKGDGLSLSAEETYSYLLSYFDIPNCLSAENKRQVLAVRYSMFLERYRKYQPITVSMDVSDKTVADIEENRDMFPGVYAETEYLRSYPDGEYFSHIIGYIRKISDTDYETFKEHGYTTNSIVGKSGIELLNELDLSGTDGQMLVEVDSVGRRVGVVETTDPTPGNDVYLTIDKNLQIFAYDTLEKHLTEVIIQKLLGTSYRDTPITLKEFFISIVDSNNIPIRRIMEGTGEAQTALRNRILSAYPDFDTGSEEDLNNAKLLITEGIENGSISPLTMFKTLIEQGMVTADESYLRELNSGSKSVLSAVIEKLRSGEIRPCDTNLDPSTGSVVISDVKTGDVLALVSYPSYDNNRLVNNFDSEYYLSLLTDPTTPLVNRALKQKKAPGSTLKMITALAGLETGAIDLDTKIKDEGYYTKTGKPYANCWIYSNTGGNHGEIDVKKALEVSCNYFFYETAYRMGNAEEGTALESITTLNEYMDAFGLNSLTGIEIGDSAPGMASPTYKETLTKWQNPDATSTQYRWTDGDTIRAAIGQSVNNFSAASMNKYIATLANGGTRMKMHLVDKLTTYSGSAVYEYEPVVENVLELKEENLNAVYEGMLAVTSGENGTLRSVFAGFPFKVAGKSGTAEESQSRASHTWFVCFAPYDDPQIAITVMIPFGESTYSPSAKVAKDIIGQYMGLNYTGESSNLTNELTR